MSGGTSLAGMPAGFTLIEVAASLAIFGIVAAGIAANTVAVVQGNRIGKNLSVATTLAQDEIEQLRALDPDAAPSSLSAGVHPDANNPITASGARGGPFTRQWTVTRDSPLPGVSSVEVSVSWSDGAPHTVRMSAYVCQASMCG
jgi:prepilin-type N-terminal cleavage/methylation domain-containing protein